jgi:hypothetical protein
MTTYHATRTEHGEAATVVVDDDGQPSSLDPRRDLKDFAPEGYDWGSDGAYSGKLALALALAADVIGDDKRALGLAFHLKCRRGRTETARQTHLISLPAGPLPDTTTLWEGTQVKNEARNGRQYDPHDGSVPADR